jgi:thiol-disulfide isomerase/thioredoxin
MIIIYIALVFITSIMIYFDYKRYLLRNKPRVCMIWIYRPDCESCERTMVEWQKFEDSKPSYIKVEKINMLEEPEIADYYSANNVVPHIVKTVDGQRYVFDGERNVDNFLQFAME